MLLSLLGNAIAQLENYFDFIKYRKIPKTSPSKYKPPKLVTQKTLH